MKIRYGRNDTALAYFVIVFIKISCHADIKYIQNAQSNGTIFSNSLLGDK